MHVYEADQLINSSWQIKWPQNFDSKSIKKKKYELNKNNLFNMHKLYLNESDIKNKIIIWQIKVFINKSINLIIKNYII